MANVDSCAVPTGYPFDRQIAAKTISLMRERIGIYAKSTVTAEFIRQANIEFVHDELAREVALKLDGFLTTGVHQPIKATVKTPTTTWQHFKHQYFSASLKKRFPVKYETHEFTLRGNMFVCPHLSRLWDRNHDQLHAEFVSLTDPLPSVMDRVRK